MSIMKIAYDDNYRMAFVYTQLKPSLTRRGDPEQCRFLFCLFLVILLVKIIIWKLTTKKRYEAKESHENINEQQIATIFCFY